ncbi:uncharacterized protein LOC115921870 [Strongylocentrotus purpuratus]|uniref:Uncharacterized protein n=1 Tax=Strongylocentrotus purpuratus TaxID=7668 RepID=A0A7M7NGE2_STRPU|nr:uncharacterized protein LOC115921870 [Strongylocentrotus purpuratus]
MEGQDEQDPATSIRMDPLLHDRDPWMEVNQLFDSPSMNAGKHSAMERVEVDDSVSQVSSKSTSHSRKFLMETAMKRAELQAKLKSLKRKQELEKEEQDLIRRKEQLAVETELAAATAQAAALQQFDDTVAFHQPPALPTFAHVTHESDRNQTSHKVKNADCSEESSTQGRKNQEHLQDVRVSGTNSDSDVDWVELQRQQTQLTYMLLECHMKSALPQRNIQPFDGNPLNYHAFKRAFQHVIESKTSEDSDKLYYLEQYTRGKANEMVRSCMYGGDSKAAFNKATMLLESKFGDKHHVLDSMIIKAMAWPNIRGEDPEGLLSYSLFVTELGNLAKDLHLQQEIDHAQHLKMVISKLPFRLRDRWRSYVDGILQNRDEPLSFKDVVSFISKQARIINNPIYGNIVGPARAGETQTKTKPFPGKKQGFSSSMKKSEEAKCLYCDMENHLTAECKALGKKPHEEKLAFCKSKGLCFACLQSSHLARDCKQRTTCKICQRLHPTLLHRDWAPSKQVKRNGESEKQRTNDDVGANRKKEESSEGQTEGEEIGNENFPDVRRTLSNRTSMQDSQPAIVPVTVRSKQTGKCVHTYAFIDNGSNATFCTEELKNKLNARGRTRTIQLQTLTDDKLVKTCILQDLEVADVNENTYIPLSDVYIQPIPVDKSDILRRNDIARWPYLQEINLPEINADVGILIGNNVPKAMEPLQVINSQNDGPFACKSIIGWMVFGSCKQERSGSKIASHRVHVMEDIQQQLNNLYNTEFSERLMEDKVEESKEDKRFMEKVEGSIKLTQGHYQIGLPFKGDVDLPNNRPMAEQRLNHLQRKFARQPQFHREYAGFMDKVLNKQYAERVPEDEFLREDGKMWFIPHHGVYHPQKQKIRVVYDCAASFKGKSLNDNLLQGPDLTNSLVGVLTRFRQDRIAVMADIEAMFSQVKLLKEEKDLHRFLWWPDGNVAQPIEEYRMTVHVFGARSSPACANYALKRTAEDFAEDKVAHIIKRNFYVDDCLYSSSTVQEAAELSEGLQEACKKGGFHLTKWVSNDRRVLNAIPKEERASTVQELDFDKDKLPTERALGMLWHTDEDVFSFKIQLKDKPATRRGILSTVCSLFDPLGCASPVLLPAKHLLQTLCRLGLGWDETIPPDLLKKWETWKRELPRLSDFKLSRCLKPEGYENPKSVTLHHFADASEKGYGTVSYLRMVNTRDEVQCSFLLSKSRVAPLKQTSIPRMELTAATVAVRIDKMVKQELDIPVDETFFWTDSTSVLQYIQSETGRFKTFVANRVALIQEGSESSQWHHIETSLNPADVCSRGVKVDQFLAMRFWKEGPEFLQASEDQWPKQPRNASHDVNNDPEVKKKKMYVTEVSEVTASESKCMATAVSKEEEDDVLERLINHYSDWYHLRKGVAWLLKLKGLLKEKMKGQQNTRENPPMLLTVEDIRQAEEAILIHVQDRAFPVEVAALRKQAHDVNQRTGRLQPGVRKSSPIYKLDPQMDNGLLRVGGRLNKAALPEEAKHPVILPKRGHVSELILRHIHENSGHMGRNYVLAKLQQRYHIVGAISAIRKVVKKCVKCRRQRGRVIQQKMADLPIDRLRPDDPPFTRVGVDYFGPIGVKRGRSTVKRYGVVFTCLAIRAIHIEKADSLDTDSCIAAIRRFIARRGAVREMRSDNGTNLVGAEKELRKELESWNQAQLSNSLLQVNIKWTFNPPGGSHHGGVWERQIRTIRQLLFFLTKQQTMTDESLQTLFCEIEGIINCRPITRVSDDANDLEALTPNKLLTLKATPMLPPSVSRQTDCYARRRWRQVQYLADVFWRRWLREYLPQLQARQKWVHPSRNIQVGDVVLVVNETAPRNFWLMGVIIGITPDRQGMVRRAEVKTKTGTYSRPISKLCLLLEGDS